MTTVTIQTRDRSATVRQIYAASFDGETETAARHALPVTVPANSEMQFTVHDGVGLMVEEGSAAFGKIAAGMSDATSYFHGIHNDA